MDVTLPTAVKFLQKGNKELARNLASYLSLAAIDYAYLLSPHVQIILDSIVSGNFGLCRALPQIYKVSPELITENASQLVDLLSKCDVQEKLALMNLFELIAKNKPSVLENSIQDLCEYISDSAIALQTMLVLLKMADNCPSSIFNHYDKIKNSAKKNPSTVSIAAKILSAGGKENIDRAQYALDFILEQLPHTDRASQTILLNEATKLCSTYPILFTEKFLACLRKRKNMNQKSSQNEKISGGVTIVNLNSENTNSKGTFNQQSGQSSSQTPQQNSQNHQTNNNTNNFLSTTVINTSNGTSSNNIIHQNHNKSKNHVTSINNHIVTIPMSNESKSIAQNSTQSSNSHTNTSTTTNSQINNGNNITNNPVPPTPPHTGYTRRAKLGDSRSTGRLHSSSNTHRSMTRLNVAGGSVGGLHKSMTRLSSSQQINQNGTGTGVSNSQNVNGNSNGSITNTNNIINSQNYVTPIPPLSSNIIITGHNK